MKFGFGETNRFKSLEKEGAYAQLLWETQNIVDLAGDVPGIRWVGAGGRECVLTIEPVVITKKSKKDHLDRQEFRYRLDHGKFNSFVYTTYNKGVQPLDDRDNPMAPDTSGRMAQSLLRDLELLDKNILIKQRASRELLTGRGWRDEDKQPITIAENSEIFWDIINTNEELYRKIASNVFDRLHGEQMEVSQQKVANAFPHWNEATVGRFVGSAPNPRY